MANVRFAPADFVDSADVWVVLDLNPAIWEAIAGTGDRDGDAGSVLV